jgi:hypothetical protein
MFKAQIKDRSHFAFNDLPGEQDLEYFGMNNLSTYSIGKTVTVSKAAHILNRDEPGSDGSNGPSGGSPPFLSNNTNSKFLEIPLHHLDTIRTNVSQHFLTR